MLSLCLPFLEQEANIIGVIGVILVLLAYLLLQVDRMDPMSVTYSLLNTVGSFGILISLYFYWNLASAVIEIAWFIISMYGLIRSIIKWRHYRSA